VFVCIILGDHKLSYREFIAVMKGWKLRGYKVMDNVCVREKSSSLLSSFSPSLSLSPQMREKKQLGGPLEEFKACVKMEMRDK
jgi:hypothetical protein